MNKQEFVVLLQSLGRIELMIKSIMEEKYGRKETNRVYKKIVKIIDNNIKLPTSLDEDQHYYRRNIDDLMEGNNESN